MGDYGDICLKPTMMGDNYYRIVKINAKARKLGISYGQYMAKSFEAYRVCDYTKTKVAFKSRRTMKAYENIKKAQQDAQARMREAEKIDTGKMSTSMLDKYNAMTEWDKVCEPIRNKLLEEEKWRDE